jgi:hypothetical protein
MGLRILLVMGGIALILAIIVLASYYIQLPPEDNNSSHDLNPSGDNNPDGITDQTSDNLSTESDDINSSTTITNENSSSSSDTDNDALEEESDNSNGNSVSPSQSSADKDSDRDGVKDSVELEMGTDPNDDDSDGDGLKDGEEIRLGTDPLSRDSDNDGLSDSQEIRLKTDPNESDSDDDGLNDWKEYNLGTNPNKEDTDGDGIDDKEEIKNGTDPLNANTDDDRYDDDEDPNPTEVNSAKVSVKLSIAGINQNLDSFLEKSEDNDELTVLVIKARVVANNTGTDYASFVKFDTLISINGYDIVKKKENLGKVEAGSALKEDLAYVIEAADIPAQVKESMRKDFDAGRTSEITIRATGIEYEKFT